MKKICIVLIYLINSFSFSQQIRFAWLSDTHIGNSTGEEDLLNSINDINKRNDIDFVIVSGDITESGRTNDFILAKNILEMLKVPYYIIPGNHDTKWSESGGEDFKKVFGGDKFIFKYNGINFIGLHQGPILRMADGYFAQEDLRWLKSKIKKINKSEPIIFITHYPIDSSVSNFYEFLNLVNGKNVKVILVGHGHTNMKLNFSGILGVMGRSNLKGNQVSNGYNIVDVRNDSILFYEKKCGDFKDSLWNKIPLNNNNSIETKLQDHSNINPFPFIKIEWIYDSKNTITSEPVRSDKGILCSNREGVFLLNKKNGKLLWKFKTLGAVYGAVATYSNKVVFGTTEGWLYCLDVKNGRLNWKINLGSSCVSVPIIEKNTIFIGSNGKLSAINLENGKIIWDFKTNGFIESKPSIYNDYIVFGAWDTYLYCLDKNSGKLIWKWSNSKSNVLLSPAVCYPVITKNKVFIVAPDRVLSAIDLKTGYTIFRTRQNYVRESIGISEDSITIYVKSMYDSVFAYNIVDDSILLKWSNDLKYGYDFAPSYPIEKKGNLFFGIKNGYVFSLNSKTGLLNWKFKVSDCLVNNILPLDSNSIVVTSLNGKVYKLIEKR